MPPEKDIPKTCAAPTTHQMELVKMWSTVFVAVCTVIIVPIMASMNIKLTQYGDRLTRIEVWMGEGRRYTRDDASKDYGIITQVLDRQGRELTDHETRIRKVEKEIPNH